MGYGLQRFSTLTQINKDTARRLVPRWAYALGDDGGQEAQPLVRDRVIYFTIHNATMGWKAQVFENQSYDRRTQTILL